MREGLNGFHHHHRHNHHHHHDHNRHGHNHHKHHSNQHTHKSRHHHQSSHRNLIKKKKTNRHYDDDHDNKMVNLKRFRSKDDNNNNNNEEATNTNDADGVIELVMKSREAAAAVAAGSDETGLGASLDESMTRIHPKENVEDPKFLQRPSDRFVRLGETAKFKCKAAGTRPMEVFWFKMNGDELVNDEKYEIYHDDEFHYLKVYNTVQRDSGMYLCVISNEIEQNVDSFFLRLRGIYYH